MTEVATNEAMVPVEAGSNLPTTVQEKALAILSQKLVARFPDDLQKDPKLALQIAEIAIHHKFDVLAPEPHIIPLHGKPYITYAGRWFKTLQHPLFLGVVENRPAEPEEYKLLHVNPEEHLLWYFSIQMKGWPRPYGSYGRASAKLEKNQPIVKDHEWEMAEKRAKWRVMRDVIPLNIEGLYEDDRVIELIQSEDGAYALAQARANKGQIAALHALAKAAGLTESQYRAYLWANAGVRSSTGLTEFQASDLIKELSERVEETQAIKARIEEHAEELAELGRDVFGDFNGNGSDSRPSREAAKQEPARAKAQAAATEEEAKAACELFYKRWNELQSVNRQLAKLGRPAFPMRALGLGTPVEEIKARVREMEGHISKGLDLVAAAESGNLKRAKEPVDEAPFDDSLEQAELGEF